MCQHGFMTANGHGQPSDDGWEPRSLSEPWYIAPVDGRATLERELRAEVAPGHPLHGQHVAAVARCAGCDDVAFRLEGSPVPRWAIVHLTWSGKPDRPPWPDADLFDSFDGVGQHIAQHEH